MSTTTVDETAKIARSAPRILAQVKMIKDRLLTRHRLAQRLFIGADGQLTQPAAEWMRRLARDNYVDGPTYAGDRDRMLINEGKRLLALEIIGSARLDAERLGALTRLERELHG